MSYDDAHMRNIAETIAVLPESAMLVRVLCGWCSGTGRVRAWNGWALISTKKCVRCAGHGHVMVEKGSDND